VNFEIPRSAIFPNSRSEQIHSVSRAVLVIRDINGNYSHQTSYSRTAIVGDFADNNIAGIICRTILVSAPTVFGRSYISTLDLQDLLIVYLYRESERHASPIVIFENKRSKMKTIMTSKFRFIPFGEQPHNSSRKMAAFRSNYNRRERLSGAL